MTVIASFLSVTALVILPGAYLSFQSHYRYLGFPTQLAISIALAPAFIFVQYYLLHFFGVPFQYAAILLIGINLPAVFFLINTTRRCASPDWKSSLGFLGMLAIPFAFLALHFLNEQTMAFSGHGWMHSDTIYQLSNGRLVPEEAEYAGGHHAYPWWGHLFQAVLSWLMDKPPVATYHWTNLIWLAVVLGLVARATGLLTENRFVKLSVIVWLCFGVNFVGYLLTVKPLNMIEWWNFPDALRIWGDSRYSPWLIKYFFFTAMPLGLALFAALMLALMLDRDHMRSRSWWMQVGLLISALGLVYPPLYPAGCALLAAKATTVLYTALKHKEKSVLRDIAGLTLTVLIASVLTFSQLGLLSTDRVNESVWITAPTLMPAKFVRTLVVLSPLWVGTVLAFAWYKGKREPLIFLLTAASLCGLLHIVFSILWEDEYKFIFTAAICLAPIAAIGYGAALDRFGRFRYPAFALASLVLCLPMIHTMYDKWPIGIPEGKRPVLDLSHFDLRLNSLDERAAIYDTIRTQTPLDTMIVAKPTGVPISTLTQRSMYVSLYEEGTRLGTNMKVDRMLKDLKGFSPEAIEARRQDVHTLFSPGTQGKRAAMAHIMSLGRPLALIAKTKPDQALMRWLEQEGIGITMIAQGGWVVRLIEPQPDHIALARGQVANETVPAR